MLKLAFLSSQAAGLLDKQPFCELLRPQLGLAKREPRKVVTLTKNLFYSLKEMIDF